MVSDRYGAPIFLATPHKIGSPVTHAFVLRQECTDRANKKQLCNVLSSLQTVLRGSPLALHQPVPASEWLARTVIHKLVLQEALQVREQVQIPVPCR